MECDSTLINGGTTMESKTQEVIHHEQEHATSMDLTTLINPWAWFQPKALHPIVLDLIYWRNVKITTAVVFGSLGLLVALAYVSFISILAYSSLATLAVTITYRIYKNIVQAVQKSNDGHPFKDWLAADTNIPFEKMHDASDVFVDQFNSFVGEMKRLFLVEDLVDSIKFGCLLWCLTYVGYWFNGLTLFIIHLVAMFSLPKIYEVNKTQVDYHVGFLRTWLGDVLGKIKGALPIGKEKAQ